MSNVSLKCEQQGDPWLTVEYTSAEDLRNRLADLMDDEFPEGSGVTIPHLIAHAQAWYRRNYALAQVVAPAVPTSPQVAPAASPVVAQPSPATTAAVPPSPPLTVVQGDLPPSVRIWNGPNPEKPQYTETFIEFPYNQPYANALKAAMEAQGAKLFWNKTAKARTTNTKNEALLRSLAVQYKDLLG